MSSETTGQRLSRFRHGSTSSPAVRSRPHAKPPPAVVGHLFNPCCASDQTGMDDQLVFAQQIMAGAEEGTTAASKTSRRAPRHDDFSDDDEDACVAPPPPQAGRRQ